MRGAHRFHLWGTRPPILCLEARKRAVRPTASQDAPEHAPCRHVYVDELRKSTELNQTRLVLTYAEGKKHQAYLQGVVVILFVKCDGTRVGDRVAECEDKSWGAKNQLFPVRQLQSAYLTQTGLPRCSNGEEPQRVVEWG